MEVADGLPGVFAVVLQDVESIAGQGGLEVGRHLLHARDDGGENIVAGIEQSSRMGLRDHEGVALRKGIDVEVGEHEVVLVDLEARYLAVGDRAEDAVVPHLRTPGHRTSSRGTRRRSCASAPSSRARER